MEVLFSVIRNNDLYGRSVIAPASALRDTAGDERQHSAVDRLAVARGDPLRLPEVVEPAFLPRVALAGATGEIDDQPVVVSGDVLLPAHALDLVLATELLELL